MPLTISEDRGQPVVDPATLAPGTIVKVYGTVPYRFRQGLLAITVPAGNLLSLASVSGLQAGRAVAGAGIATGTTVATVLPGVSKVRLSAPVAGVVASGATLTFSRTVATTAASASGPVLTLPTAGLSAGEAVTGTNIPPGTTVQTIMGPDSLVLSAPVTAPGVASGDQLVFSAAAVTSAETTPASVAPLGLQVTVANPPAVVGNGYQNAVGALVYTRSKTSFTALARARAKEWLLIPTDNIVPVPASYV